VDYGHTAEYILVLLLPTSVIGARGVLPIVSPLDRVKLGLDVGRPVGRISEDDQWMNRDGHDVNVFCRGDGMLNSKGTRRVIYPDLFCTRPSLTKIDISHPLYPQLHSDST
jgi:hypothetical protein